MILNDIFFIQNAQNLQSEGHGISGFQTMLSIGLGQEQQFSATCCIVKSYAVIILLRTVMLICEMRKIPKHIH